MRKEEIAIRAKASLDLFEQGELIDIVAFSQDVRSLIAMTVCKSSEEIQLSDLPKPELYYCDSSIPYEAYEADVVREYARQAIEADRASRQVKVPDVIYEAIAAAFEDRKGWRTKIAAAVRALPERESK